MDCMVQNSFLEISRDISLSSSWSKVLKDEFTKTYMTNLIEFLKAEKSKNKVIYPVNKSIFRAFELTEYEKVRVVILGQDPYHGPNQANGLCFSVNKGISFPPSLQNIFKELNSDIGFKIPEHGCLDKWAKQGILLLNSVLTVEHKLPNSHEGKGWEVFTDRVFEVLNERENPIIFLLWGAYACKKGRFINKSKHLVLTSSHPSPLSSYRGFFGCKHFSQVNRQLKLWKEKEVDWQL